jgi:hypothetical protein
VGCQKLRLTILARKRSLFLSQVQTRKIQSPPLPERGRERLPIIYHLLRVRIPPPAERAVMPSQELQKPIAIEPAFQCLPHLCLDRALPLHTANEILVPLRFGDRE